MTRRTRVNLAASSGLLAAILLGIGCSTPEPDPVPDAGERDPFSDTAVDYVAVEVTVDDADLSIWDVPLRAEALIDTTPEVRNDGLIVGELGVDSGNREMIVALAEEIGHLLAVESRSPVRHEAPPAASARPPAPSALRVSAGARRCGTP